MPTTFFFCFSQNSYGMAVERFCMISARSGAAPVLVEVARHRLDRVIGQLGAVGGGATYALSQ
jgi:hypothetical protein